MSFRALPVTLSVILSVGAPSAARGAQRVAVLTPSAPWSPRCADTGKLQDDRLQQQCLLLDTLADEARAGVLAAVKSAGYVVMTRENTAQILKDMGSSAACVAEGECEVETAKLIGADFVVSGNVAVVEGTWFVALKLHETRTANLINTTPRTRTTSQVEMVETIRALAETLVRAGLKITSTAGTLEFDVAEQGAQVILDGEEIGRGPYRGRRSAAEGAHRIVVAKDGFATWESAVHLDAGGRATVSPRLVQLPSFVRTEAPARTPKVYGPIYAELRPGTNYAIHYRTSSGVSTCSTSLFACMGLLPSIRTGYRLSSTWALEAGFTFMTHARDLLVGGQSSGVADSRGKLAGVGAAWRPAALRFVSLAGELGPIWSSQDVQVGKSPVLTKNVTTIFAAAEARLDYPLGWFVLGLRAGVVGFNSPSTSQSGTVVVGGVSIPATASIESGPIVLGTLGVGLGARF